MRVMTSSEVSEQDLGDLAGKLESRICNRDHRNCGYEPDGETHLGSCLMGGLRRIAIACD